MRSFTVGLGAAYDRSRTDAIAAGPGARSELRSAYLGTGEQVHDVRTLQDHVAPHTTSDLLCQGAVAGQSRSVYSGLIRVRRGAVRTVALQTNHNLVLDERAHADSVPNLDIEENDVRCSHASTVGPIDEDQRYYLESRGIAPDRAERLIVLGFFDDIVERSPVPAVVGRLRREVGLRLADALAPDASAPDASVAGRPDVRGGAGRWVSASCCAGKDELEPGQARRFDVGPVRIALVRIGDDFYAIGDRCSHEDFSLAEGEVWVDECELECARHGSTFDLRTGQPCSLPATKSVPVYDVDVDGDDVGRGAPVNGRPLAPDDWPTERLQRRGSTSRPRSGRPRRQPDRPQRRGPRRHGAERVRARARWPTRSWAGRAPWSPAAASGSTASSWPAGRPGSGPEPGSSSPCSSRSRFPASGWRRRWPRPSPAGTDSASGPVRRRRGSRPSSSGRPARRPLSASTSASSSGR